MSHKSQPRQVEAISYQVHQDMVRRPRPAPVKDALSALMAIVFGLPVFSVVAPLMYIATLNKNWSQRFASVFLPIVMPMMDKAFKMVKQELLKDLHGRVLDVGCGDGAWLKYFGAARHVTELEPNPFLIPKIYRNVEKFRAENPKVEVEIVNKFSSELDPTKPYDYVVFGNVMCEVPNQASFLREIDRVLKPGGKIVFLEHIRYPRGTFLGWFQDFLNPWWSQVSDGCNCNRHTLDALRAVKGWDVQTWELEQDGPPHLTKMAAGIITKSAVPDTGAVARF